MSKAIADRIDFGSILMEATEEDKEKLKTIVENNNFIMPNTKLSIYKNRQGKWKGIYLWMNADKGACRFDTIFCTDWNYNIVEVDNLQIEIQDE